VICGKLFKDQYVRHDVEVLRSLWGIHSIKNVKELFRMNNEFLHFTNDCHFHFTQNEDAFICVCYVNSILHVTFIFIILDERVSRGNEIYILVGTK